MKVEELGSLRLNIVYTEDHVFPSEHYTPLRDLLLHSANVGVRVRRTCVLFGCPAASVCVVCAMSHLRARTHRVDSLFSPAGVGVHSSHPGGGVSRETGSCYPPRASVSSLRQDRAFYQRHRSR